MLLAYIGLMNTSLKYKDTETRDYKQHNEELNSLLLQHNEEVKLTQETYMQNMIVDMVYYYYYYYYYLYYYIYYYYYYYNYYY